MTDVTQADRDAVNALDPLLLLGLQPYEVEHLGEAFARHRQAAYEAGLIEGARLMQEAAAMIAAERDIGDEEDESETGSEAAFCIMCDIRALDPASVVRGGQGEPDAL